MASNSGLKKEQVAKIILDGVTLDEDIKLYKKLSMTKMLAHQVQIFYEVKLLSQILSI